MGSRTPSGTSPQKIHAKHQAYLYASMHKLLFGNNQSSRLYHLQDAIRSPELLHLRQEIGGSIAPDPGLDTGLWVPARRHPGSPLRSTPGQVLGTAPFLRERKTSDKENLPYFRIWKSLTYSNRLSPALRRLYKENLNPRARDRHFKT
ncbi:hypothetical protein F2Q70_00038572 [Brassica cretica]|uniref:Uncharacterized protein n=1 Tax=Brassica cretica TaxID=69181 RepID=A0A3N6S0I1_BRACR|nr:hypothetical protein F2Q70_00038572 [Brassica cretica]KAF3495992.1 hypothetical protein DY000_02052832 [Brassica cretica]